MDIRSSLESLKTIFGASPTASAARPQTRSGSSSSSDSAASDRATLSSAGSHVALANSDSDVRLEKVASIRSQLLAGTYNVPASAVAGKLVTSLLAGER